MSLTGSFTSDVLAKGMDGHFARQTAIAGNLANSETPGYHRRDVQFGDALEQVVERHRQNQSQMMADAGGGVSMPQDASAMRATRPLHFGFDGQSQSSPADVLVEPTEDKTHQFRADDNGVDVETEMVRLSQNASRFKALTVLQGRWNQQVKSVINSNG